MPTAQIYQLDDVLIRSGVIALVVLAIVVLAFTPWERSLSLATVFWLSLASLAPIGMLAGGLSVRLRENRIRAVWRLLHRSLEVDVQALLRASSFKRKDLEETVRVLNDRGLGHYVWDADGNTIRDGRLDVRVAHSTNCDECGANISLTLSMADAPYCPFCSAPLPAEAVNALKHGTIQQLRSPPPGPGADATFPEHALPGPTRRMSITLFVMLLLVFWPAALIYALYAQR